MFIATKSRRNVAVDKPGNHEFDQPPSLLSNGIEALFMLIATHIPAAGRLGCTLRAL